MTTLRFEIMGTCALINHAQRATEWSTGWVIDDNDELAHDPNPRPQLIFVHDDGLYLMSNGIPAEGPNGETYAEGEIGPRRTVHAEGFDPKVNTFEEWWDGARAVVGGDDFAQYFDVEDVLPIPENATAFLIEVTPDTFDMFWELAVPTRRKVEA